MTTTKALAMFKDLVAAASRRAGAADSPLVMAGRQALSRNPLRPGEEAHQLLRAVAGPDRTRRARTLMTGRTLSKALAVLLTVGIGNRITTLSSNRAAYHSGEHLPMVAPRNQPLSDQ